MQQRKKFTICAKPCPGRLQRSRVLSESLRVWLFILEYAGRPVTDTMLFHAFLGASTSKMFRILRFPWGFRTFVYLIYIYIYNYRFQIYDLLVISFPSPVCHIMRLLVFPYLAGLSPQQWLRKLLLTRQAWHMSYKSLNANWVWQGGKLLNALEFFPTIDWRKSSLFAFCSEPVRFCAAFVHQQISLNCCSWQFRLQSLLWVEARIYSAITDYWLCVRQANLCTAEASWLHDIDMTKRSV